MEVLHKVLVNRLQDKASPKKELVSYNWPVQHDLNTVDWAVKLQTFTGYQNVCHLKYYKILWGTDTFSATEKGQHYINALLADLLSEGPWCVGKQTRSQFSPL